MRTKVLLLASLLFGLAASAQDIKTVIAGNGDIIKEKREVAGYRKIKIDGPFTVTLIEGETGSITVEGERDLVSQVAATAKDSTLHVSVKDDKALKTSKNNKLRIKIPYIGLEEVALRGAGSITARKTLRAQNLRVTLDGAGSIDLNVDAVNVAAWVLGPGNITINGTAQNFDCKVVGSGIVSAYRLTSEHASALVSGAGDAQVNSTKTIKGRIGGPGNIVFAGNPQQTDLRLAGTGTISAY